jgi:hypothetical protein
VVEGRKHPEGQSTAVVLPGSDTLRDLERIGGLTGQAKLDADQEPHEVCMGSLAGPSPAGTEQCDGTLDEAWETDPRPAWLSLQPVLVECQERHHRQRRQAERSQDLLLFKREKKIGGVTVDSCKGIRAGRIRFAPGQGTVLLLRDDPGFTETTRSFQ